MDNKQPGNKNMPDFKELNDRIIADASEQPFLVIKTNLDPKSAVEDNPYYKGSKSESDKQSFTSYFDEES